MTPSRPLIYRSCNQYSSLSQVTHAGKDANFTRSKGGRHEMLLRTENLGNFAIVGVPETHRHSQSRLPVATAGRGLLQSESPPINQESTSTSPQ